jgi:CRP/FNR family transcriptional regulator
MAFDASIQINPCLNCQSSRACLGRQFGEAAQGACASSVTLKADQHLFRTGDTAHSIYMLRSGALKAYVTSPDGEEQILAFYSPGDVIGLESMSEGRRSRNVVTLSAAEVCRVPVEALLTACGRSENLQTTLIDGMGREIQRLQGMLRLERMTAERRIALFLLNQARRQARDGEPQMRRVVNLPMSRGEIGRFLDLATETVSRCLTRLQASGAIRISRNDIELLDVPALQGLTQPMPTSERKMAA